MTEASVFEGKKAVYFTLGCKLNFAETSTIGRLLKEMGVRTVRAGERADICVVNTCSVTEVADHKCRQAIHKLVKQHPGAFVVVTGCYAQLKPGDVAKIDGVDVVLGVGVVMPPELIGPQGALQIGQGVAVRLKGAEQEGELESSGPESLDIFQKGRGQQLVTAFLQDAPPMEKIKNNASIARFPGGGKQKHLKFV